MDVTERCPACGAQLAPDVDWCGQCYARISRSDGAARVRAPSEAPAPSPSEVPDPGEVERAQAAPEAPVSLSPVTAFDFVEGVSRRAAAASASPGSVATLAPRGTFAPLVATPTMDAPGADDAALMAALSASTGPALSFGPHVRTWASALVVLVAVGTDFLFFPYSKFMALYGIFAAMLSGYVLHRMWRRGSSRRAVQ